MQDCPALPAPDDEVNDRAPPRPCIGVVRAHIASSRCSVIALSALPAVHTEAPGPTQEKLPREVPFQLSSDMTGCVQSGGSPHQEPGQQAIPATLFECMCCAWAFGLQANHPDPQVPHPTKEIGRQHSGRDSPREPAIVVQTICCLGLWPSSQKQKLKPLVFTWAFGLQANDQNHKLPIQSTEVGPLQSDRGSIQEGAPQAHHPNTVCQTTVARAFGLQAKPTQALCV